VRIFGDHAKKVKEFVTTADFISYGGQQLSTDYRCREATQFKGDDEMPTLEFKNKSLGSYHFEEGASVTIGRRQENDVVIDDPAVSGHHARIDSVGNRLALIDLKSKNGSFVNEQLVSTHWLKHGDVVTIGGHELVLNYPESEIRHAADPDEFSETLEMKSAQHRRMLSRSNPNRSINMLKFWEKNPNRGKVRDLEQEAAEPGKKEPKATGVLTYLSGGSGQVTLNPKITTIGRDPSSDIVVRGMLIDPTTATIRKEPGGYYLSYFSGLTKPKVNEKVVKEPILLKDLDIIEVGSVKLQFSERDSTEIYP
jgi:pSer/pThr/pTyr-binding forkhead associated (FHA) protein